MNKIINKAKKLIDLPYNLFNLDNYKEILEHNFNGHYNLKKNINEPCQLMSGEHQNAGIITNLIGNDYKVILIGKGILFDSGGLNLKNRDLSEMKNDKAGMIIACAVSSYFKKDVYAYCPVTTNFIQTSKITPGDILKIGSKSVEITDTDAEGRLILAEALSHAAISPSDIIITIATLTGCVGYAIDNKATGVFGVNQELINKFLESSKEEKEYAWQLPLWDYFDKKYYKGNKIKNYTKEIKAGASEGANFIKQFVKFPHQWLHLDIAYSSFDDKHKANGVPIKSLINFIRKIK